MLEHAEEIKSRPARTWFQTQSDKNAAKSASRALDKFDRWSAMTDGVSGAQSSARTSTMPSSRRRRRSAGLRRPRRNRSPSR